MKILIVMDPGILIPVKGYGGIERIIEMLAIEHAKNGHEVHLLITAGSSLEGCIVHGYGKEGFPPGKWDARKAIPVVWKFLLKHTHEFDLIHNFGRLIYLLPVLNHPVNKIMSYQREITRRNIKWINTLPNKNLVFTGCSQDLIQKGKLRGNWEVVYNACDFEKYRLQHKTDDGAPLFFLGRIEKVKGCHIAISVAKATGNKLVIAGNISTLPEEKAYFENEIAPHIDGQQIQYIGVVNDAQKNEWLGKAKALLFPIEWSEPFGIVMIEAMACGTPVIAFNKGSVNEVVEENVTGFKVRTIEEMVEVVNKIKTIDRTDCRRHAQTKFDISMISSQYLGLFESAVPKILIVTTGQPAANPRVMKEYEALKEKGYKVKVLYTYSLDWSFKIDEEKFKRGDLAKQDFVLVGGDPFNNKFTYFSSRLFFKISQKISRLIPLVFLKEISIARSSLYLCLNTKKYKADLYMAHYLGALPAAIMAASKWGAAVVFDAEDFHRGEDFYNAAQVEDVIEMEDRIFPRVNLITTASPLISDAYQKLYPAKKIITINNVFSKKYLQLAKNHQQQGIKLFWFSQNIGPNRGLEVIIDAVNCLDEHASLTLMGNTQNEAYIQQLLNRSKCPERIHFSGTVNPEEIFHIAAGFDIGIAAEIASYRNRDICLTNKIFTYLLAGNCILASDTLAQKDFINTYPAIGLLYKQNDAADLCAQIMHLVQNKDQLKNCKSSSLELADRILNWESESEKFIAAIESIVQPNGKKISLFETERG